MGLAWAVNSGATFCWFTQALCVGIFIEVREGSLQGSECLARRDMWG